MEKSAPEVSAFVEEAQPRRQRVKVQSVPRPFWRLPAAQPPAEQCAQLWVPLSQEPQRSSDRAMKVFVIV